MAAWEIAYDWFWSESFWLPGAYSWTDFENKDDGMYHPQASDLYIVIPIAGTLLVLRTLFERFVARPFFVSLGVKDKKTIKPDENPCLEDAYRLSKCPDDATIMDLSKTTSMTIRQVQRWFRLRKNVGKVGKLQKITEASWRFVFYLFVFYWGLYVLLDKPWFSDVSMCWVNFPHQHVPNDIFWYYIIELSFYVSLLTSIFYDVKRKDFVETFIHHVLTIVLMFYSWCNNFVRIGTLVLCVHDACDYLLEFAKISSYMKYKVLCKYVFIVFTLMWCVTRLTIFPFWLIDSTLLKAIKPVGFCKVYYLYNGCLISLLILHLIWFYYICKIAYNMWQGETAKDSRSDTEDENSSDDTQSTANGSLKKES